MGRSSASRWSRTRPRSSGHSSSATSTARRTPTASPGVEETTYTAATDASAGALRNDAETTANIRILDPAIVSPSFGQLEQFKQYYLFPSDLDVDRYTIDGETQDAVVAVRELNQDGLGAGTTWYNHTVVYTHGYGLVAAYGNQRSTDGQPVFLECGIPSTGALGDFEPRVYFGENSPTYSIVGGPESSDPIELDYPSGGGTGDRQTTTRSPATAGRSSATCSTGSSTR